MIIKSISIQNFRQYKDFCDVKFATDRDKNVTVILGLNTSGKTTIVQAFKWCLYGETSFSKKEMLLNSEVAEDLIPYATATIKVEIKLIHENREYTICRSQVCRRTPDGRIVYDRPNVDLSYKSENGNTNYIMPSEVRNVINNILPHDLSDYFFFDGERLQEITKKDVVSAVRSLMGLDIISAAVEHLEKVIEQLQASLSLDDDELSAKKKNELTKAIGERDAAKLRLENTKKELIAAQNLYDELSAKLKDTESVREAQRERENILKIIDGAKLSLETAKSNLIKDFNRDYFRYLAKPLMEKALETIKISTTSMAGIPKMHSESIEHILKRGRCICGCDLTKNQGAVDNIKFEQSLLPPHHIGTDLANFNNTCKVMLQENARYLLNETINSDYCEIRRLERQIADQEENLKEISKKIRELGEVKEITALEDDYQRAKNQITDLTRRQGSIEQEIKTLDSQIENLKATIDNLATQCEKNDLIRRELAYAQAAYDWFKQTYNKQEKEVKVELLNSVNRIFKEMYHGTRSVAMDDKYSINLTTTVGSSQIETEESKGLEAVKNFSFIAGLVEVARNKARKRGLTNLDAPESDNEENLYSSEPYPIVMDAPFSNVDEVHIQKIATILPNIAEQVILIVMEKDWVYAKQAIGEKVGANYIIQKVENSDTHSVIRRI